jgi:hypothetical protein
MNEELAQFVSFGRQLPGAFVPIGPGFQQVGIFDPDHGRARAAGQDNSRVGFKDFDDSFGQFDGLGLETTVEEGLATAGLFGGKGNGAACLPQQFDGGQADFRHYLVYQAGDTQGDLLGIVHGSLILPHLCKEPKNSNADCSLIYQRVYFISVEVKK